MNDDDDDSSESGAAETDVACSLSLAILPNMYPTSDAQTPDKIGGIVEDTILKKSKNKDHIISLFVPLSCYTYYTSRVIGNRQTLREVEEH